MRFTSRSTRALAALALCSLLATGLRAQEAEAEAPAAADLASDEDKLLYAMGMAVAQQISGFGLTEAELEIVGQGMADAVLGRTPKVDLQTYGPRLSQFARERVSALAEVEKAEADKFVAAAAAGPGAETTDSGLVYAEITAGSGASPQASDTVKVHYHGKLRDGSVFDSSVDRGEPAQFPLNQVIPCWTEGLQKMKVGGKSRLVCPSAIAYGDQGRPPTIPGGAALDFEVELLEIVALGE